MYLIIVNPCIVKENLNLLPYLPTLQNDVNEINLVY